AGLAAGEVGAAGLSDVCPDRGEGAVASRAKTDPLAGGGTVPDGEILGLPVEHELHRSSRLAGKQRRDDVLLPGDLLGPEAAAHVLLDHAEAMLGQAERLRDLFPHSEDGLGGVVKREMIALPRGRAAMRL